MSKYRFTRDRLLLVLAVVFLVLVMVLPSVHAAGFSDVTADDELTDAVSYLSAHDIVQGYSDGTFRPDNDVLRAEALKLIAVGKGVSVDSLGRYTSSSFSDVVSGAWYLPYVEWGVKDAKIINGPSTSTTFSPGRTVTKAEFLKMFLLAQGEDPNAFSEIKLPLSSDVTDPSTWYYPFLRLSFAYSMTMIPKSGTIHPERTLTRADVALLMYRYYMYKDGKRTQALLSEIENEIVQTTNAINDTDVRAAEYASARALLAGRGAHEIAPNTSLVNAALKIAEAYRALVRGYRAGLEQRYEDAIKLSKDAWSIAKTAMELDASVKSIATLVQQNAASMAQEMRSH